MGPYNQTRYVIYRKSVPIETYAVDKNNMQSDYRFLDLILAR